VLTDLATMTIAGCVGSGRPMLQLNWDRSIQGNDSRWSIDASCEKSGATRRGFGKSRGKFIRSWCHIIPRASSNPRLAFRYRQRRLPSNIKNAAALKKTMLDARKTKDENRRRHTREGLVKPKAERKSEYHDQWSTPVLCRLIRYSSRFRYSTEVMVTEQR
jgi:hypothetical protein